MHRTDLSQYLLKQLHQHQPSRLVLAYSGGLDSQVLLHLLWPLCQQHAIPLQVVHVHHGLSPQADAWARFCQQQCRQLNLPFELCHVHLPSNTNIEQQARRARYQVLADYITEPQTSLVCAHHADDQFETLLLALKRGAGLNGLAAMPSCRHFAKGQLWRPLLAISRQQLMDYATSHALSWVEDESNQNTEFERNFVRHAVSPVLKQRWPQWLSTVGRSVQHLQDAASLAEYYTEQALARCATPDKLDLIALSQQHPLQQDLVLRRWLYAAGFNPDTQWLLTLKQQVIAAKADAQPQLVAGRLLVRRYQQHLYLLNNDSQRQALPSCVLTWQQACQLPEDRGQLLWHKTKVAGALAIAEASQQYQVVFGMLNLPFKPTGKQTKPLKQWFKLWQSPPWQRGQIPLLLHEGQLVLVAGYASSYSDEQAKAWLSWQPAKNELPFLAT
ncbi:tRNA lysidine(34) synthetase TilS [Alishewanella sp. 16-MA]|uniref:tRNA(Ile)-lysidine synthase n=1 Tax=Alishewanella maricola TaxID=2795740 RepID=A0ABS8C020_9ALTE|nr:tRNA lysidine(34) synthetase TilS [Alishewanella maricola]MCB5225657.1 tRNA lysidine(34) synthetase TilS [Alishewanella maricola]